MHYLKEIAAIRSGYLFRGKIEPDADGQYQVVQIGDVSSQPGLSFSGVGLTRTQLPDVKPSQLLARGDVLFVSRGPRKHAVAIVEPLAQAIATSQFFILRPAETVLPEYLAWYINQAPAQRYINEHSTGSAVTLINLEALKLLPIETPPLATQQRIVRIEALAQRERELVAAIQNRRRALIEAALLKSIQRRES